MFKTSVARRAAQAIAQEKFDSILHKICNGKKRLGLAISGGVDSMALASLCSKVQSFDCPSLTAFIVDHRLRPESTEEASSVAQTLEKLGLKAIILTLNWGDIEDPSKLPNLETRARQLRFQALGTACQKGRISDLLLAHHGDDQAETILGRIYAGYTGSGLQGILESAPIPECHGMYGVSESGQLRKLGVGFKTNQTRLSTQGGGVTIHRPLLAFEKSELIATCRARQVDWHEDATNADKTLTVRNTVRHFLQTGALPSALRSNALRNLAEAKARRQQVCEDAASAMFKACRIELDVCTSNISFELPIDIEDRLTAETNPQYVATLLARKVLSVTEDKSKLQIQDLQQVVGFIFPTLFKTQRSTMVSVNIGRIELYRSPRDPKLYHTRVRPPRASEDHSYILVTGEEGTFSDHARWTKPKLFYDRWWIRLGFRPSNVPFGTSLILRFLQKEDLAKMRSEIDDTRVLEARLQCHAPGNSRFALPAIVERSEYTDQDGTTNIEETVWCLPTIGWSRFGFKHWNGVPDEDFPWRYTAPYKKTDLEESENHYTRPWLHDQYKKSKRIVGKAASLKESENEKHQDNV